MFCIQAWKLFLLKQFNKERITEKKKYKKKHTKPKWRDG